ncbi:inositol monophosphatase [Bacteroidia bacterium]|nr:inositol monophosphatase [Bacteroidia bacterium]
MKIMNMENKLNLQETLAFAVHCAQEIGKIHLSYFRCDNQEATTKSYVSDVVTRADKESEAYFLAEIAKRYPDHAVLGEESGMHSATGDYCWVVDPLDGTNSYSQGLPVFSVSIALQYRGETLLGVVYAPYLSELYTAIKGEGAFLNGDKIHVSKKTELDVSVLGTGFPYDKAVNPANNIDNFAAIEPYLRGIRRMGSAAYDLCCVAAGWLDGYWELNLNLWDMCAGALMVEEAGGVVRSFREDRNISIVTGNKVIVEKILSFVS